MVGSWIVGFLFVGVGIGSAGAWAAPGRTASVGSALRPAFPPAFPNESYLTDYQHQPEEILLIREEKTAELRQQYEDLVRDYQRKRDAGLLDPITERHYHERVNEFSKSLANQVRDYQVSQNVEQIRKNIMRDDSAREVAKPLGVMGAMAAVYSGQPLEIPLSEQTRFFSQTNFPGQSGEFRFTSPLLSGKFEVRLAAPELQDMSLGPGAQGERFRLSLYRTLPVLDLASAMSYGSSSRTVNASVSKALAPRLSLAVGMIRGLTQYSWDEETVHLSYGIRF